MPTYEGGIGPRGLLLPVGLSVSTDSSQRGLGGPAATYAALLDTGASITAVSPRVQELLQATILGAEEIERPNAEPVIANTVDVRIKIGGHESKGRWFDLAAVVAQPVTPRVDVLLGRDLLEWCVLTWDGPRWRYRIVYR